MPTVAEDQAFITSARAQLNSATTYMAENNRQLRFDLTVLRQQLAEAEARVDTALGCRPPVRRLLTIQYGKGL